MTQKHEALLQMFGEKAEEAEELKMDIEDLKIMYRQQVKTNIFIPNTDCLFLLSPLLYLRLKYYLAGITRTASKNVIFKF